MMHMEISNEPKRGKKSTTDIRNATKEVLGIGDLVVKERQVNLSRKGGWLEKKRDEEFFVVEQIMENGNIKLRDWNTNTIEDETIPPQQLKKMYLDNMKMEDIEKNFKKHKIVEEEKMEMTTITETTPTTSLTRNKLINQMTTTLIANSQDMDMLDSPTISMTSSPTVTLTENTEEYQMFTNTTDAKTPQRPSDIEMFTITNMTSTLITITIPHIETQTILYDDDKLPNLTQMGTEQKGPSNTYVDIFMLMMNQHF